MLLAHVNGVPVEEALPGLLAVGGMLVAYARLLPRHRRRASRDAGKGPGVGPER